MCTNATALWPTEDMDRRLMASLITNRDQIDAQVLLAASGEEALKVMDDSPIDLVITDLNMPGMNGLELLRVLQDKSPTVPVILATAFGSEELASQALVEGAASYIPKSALMTLLVPTVERVLRLKGTSPNRPVRFFSCFISYATEDEAFCEHLYSRLAEYPIHLWYAPRSTRGGDR